MTPVLEVIRSQLPVGQGGLHSMVLRLADRELWLAYDCGSSNRSALWRELDGIDNDYGDKTLDMLVLSHLDEDHVNGVERLLARRKIRRVVLPYLEDNDKLLLLARAAAEDSITETNVRLYSDPEGWFERRGVEQVIRVGPARGGDAAPPEPPEVPLPDVPHDLDLAGPDDDPWRVTLRGGRQAAVEPTGPKRRRPAQDRPPSPPSTSTRLDLPAGAALTIRAGMSPVWELVPFWYPPEDLDSFVKKVRRRFRLKGKISAKQLRPILASHTERRDLADLYRTVFSDRNWTSLCLYSGPGFRPDVHGAWHGERGWLMTGDAPLASPKFREPFRRYYAGWLSLVDTFVLPHHGSRKSFPSHGLPGLMPDTWIAAAGKNSYGHPDAGLRAALRRRASFHQVSTRRGSRYDDQALAFRLP